MFPNRQESVVTAPQFNSKNKYGGNKHQWPAFRHQVELYSKTLDNGAELLSDDFQPPEPTQQDIQQIAHLKHLVNTFQPLAVGNQAAQNTHMAIHQANMMNLQISEDRVYRMTCKMVKLTLAASKIVERMKDITIGPAHTSIITVDNIPGLSDTKIPATMLSAMRTSLYPSGSARATALAIKRQTEVLPMASTTDDILYNAEFLETSLIGTIAVQREHAEYCNPPIALVDREIAHLQQQILELQAPPANMFPGALHAVDQNAVQPLQDQIHGQMQYRQRLVARFNYDQAPDLDEATLGQALLDSLLITNTDSNYNKMRDAIYDLVHDPQGIRHPFSSFKAKIQTLRGQQALGRPQASTLPHHGQMQTGYSAYDYGLPQEEVFFDASANAAYANAPQQSRRPYVSHSLPLQHQVCREHLYEVNGCQTPNCPRIHNGRQGSLSPQARRQNNPSGYRGNNNNYQGSNGNGYNQHNNGPPTNQGNHYDRDSRKRGRSNSQDRNNSQDHTRGNSRDRQDRGRDRSSSRDDQDRDRDRSSKQQRNANTGKHAQRGQGRSRSRSSSNDRNDRNGRSNNRDDSTSSRKPPTPSRDDYDDEDDN